MHDKGTVEVVRHVSILETAQGMVIEDIRAAMAIFIMLGVAVHGADANLRKRNKRSIVRGLFDTVITMAIIGIGIGRILKYRNTMIVQNSHVYAQIPFVSLTIYPKIAIHMYVHALG
jgi:hypothetical protein